MVGAEYRVNRRQPEAVCARSLFARNKGPENKVPAMWEQLGSYACAASVAGRVK